MKTDFYQLLGVAKDATPDALKKAYRKMAMQYHPDRNPGDKAAEEKFKQMSEAYAVLSDPEKRKKYDAFGSAEAFNGAYSTEDIFRDFNMDDILQQFGMKGSGWGNFKFRRGAGGAAGGPGGPGGPGGVGGGGAGSIFDDLFGGGGGGGAPGTRARPPGPAPRGQDAEVPITIGFHEAMHGTDRPLKLHIDGEDRDLTVRIPAGIATGKKLRIKGEGHRGAAGKGDLHLSVTVAEDPRFERKGDDLYTTAQVRPSTLLLGGQVEVETLKGKRNVKVSQGTSSGAMVRVRKQGAPVLGKAGEHGDLYVRLEVTPPATLSDDQKRAAEALRDAGL